MLSSNLNIHYRRIHGTLVQAQKINNKDNCMIYCRPVE